MAIWKDFNKDDENKVIDWINHMHGENCQASLNMSDHLGPFQTMTPDHDGQCLTMLDHVGPSQTVGSWTLTP